MGEDGGVPDPYAPPKPAAGQPPRPARPPRSPGGDPLAAESRLAWYTGLGALLLTVPSSTVNLVQVEIELGRVACNPGSDSPVTWAIE